MSNLQPQELKEKVLRLQELLDQLRSQIRQRLRGTAQTHQVAKFFQVSLANIRPFWEEDATAGSVVMNAIQAKMGSAVLTTEILSLLDEMSDSHKSLVRYPASVIDLVYDVTAVFHSVGRRSDIRVRDEQMNGEQFASLFGSNAEYVRGIVARKFAALQGCSEQSQVEIRKVLNETDWKTISPTPTVFTEPLEHSKAAKLKVLLEQIQPRFSSRWAMLKALGIHQESLKNAFAGKARPKVINQMLESAQKLLKTKSSNTEEAAPVTVGRAEPEHLISVHDPYSFTASYVSQLNSSVRMLEAASVCPAMFTDGNRANLLRIIDKLVELAGIDEEAIRRIKSVDGMSAGDPRLGPILSALRGAKNQ